MPDQTVLSPVGGAAGSVVTVVPSGALNGVNKIFTIPDVPIPGSMTLFLNIVQSEGSAADYVLTGNQIAFRVAPDPGDAGWFYARYSR